MNDGNLLIRLLPFQLAETAAGTLIRRGALRLMLDGDGIAEIVARLQEVASDAFCSRHDLLALVPPIDRPRVDALLRELAIRRLAELRGPGAPTDAAPRHEDSEDVFFWQLGMTRDQIRSATGGRIALVGVNALSLALIEHLGRYGSWQAVLIDDVPLRNHALYERGLPAGLTIVDAAEADEAVRAANIVVACAEFGGLGLLKPWNALAAAENRPFLPVIVEDLTARLGPLSIPDETACLECLDARQNSHLKGRPSDRRLMEEILARGQDVSGTHPALIAMAAPLAAFELLRFAADLLPRRVGKLIELNLMGSSMVASRVLKAPRCPVCSPMKHAGKLALEKVALNPERWAEVEAMGGPDGPR